MKSINLKIDANSEKFMEELTRVCGGQVPMQDLWEKAFQLGLEQIAQAVTEAAENDTSD
jgi:hypothetical protein